MNRLIGTTLIMLGLAAGLSAQSIAIGTASTGPGGNPSVSVQFSPGSAQVAGVQFDILYDSTQLTAIAATAGAATNAAGKGLSTSHPACPGGSGVANCADLRIIDAGLNQNTISAGDIVDLAITVAGGATPQVDVLTATGSSASDPGGVSLPLSATNGSVTVLAVLSVTGPATLPTGTVGVAYPSTTVTAGGGTPPYTFTATGFTGTGLTFTNGVITGTPTASGTFPIVVTLKDSASGTATKNYSLLINPTLSITGPATLPAGTAGSAYTATTVTAQGGSGTGYTFTAPALPANMTIGASTGIISGTPAAAFNGPVIVTVTDSASATASKTYTLVVSGPLGISGPATLPVATVSAAYTATIQGSGGSGNYSWAATGLPTGLAIGASTGIISGTPTVNSGSPYSVTVTLTDTSSQATVNKVYTLTVNTALVVTAPTSLPVGTAGKAYTSTAATATGGSGTYTWTAPGLPSGLTVAPTTGIISGTPAAAFTGNISLTATDTNSVVASKSLALTIYATLTISTPATLPAATVGFAYPVTTVAATGGSGTNTWSATGLPAGLSIGSGTGVISGTPNTSTGSPFSVVVTVNDTASNTATKNYTITINGAPSITAPATLPVGTVNAAYTATTVTATGGTGTLTFSATGLPAGMTIGAATGIIGGTPTTNTGSPFSVVVTATDSVSATATKTYTLTINPALVITAPASLPTGVPSVAYPSTTVTATGGAGAPYTFSATGLPTGLTIGAATGIISGTPTSSVGSPFTVVVSVTDSNSVKSSKTYSLALAPPLLISGPATLPSGTSNVTYNSVTVTASGGSGSYSFTATGLPTGITISTAGAITGIPTSTPGTYNVVVTVKDTNNTTATMSYSLVIAALPLKITSGDLPNGIIGIAYRFTAITASGGVGAYTYSITGLPPGLTTDGNGDISGTPTSTVGSPFTVTATITDAAGNTITQTYKVTISPVLSVGAPTSLPAAGLNSPYTATVTAAGGAAPYTWAATGLPTGLSIGIATGVISGTPTTATGSPFSVVVTVTDSTGAKATKTYSLAVNSGLSITGPASLAAAVAGTAYTATTVTAQGGSGVYTWSAAGLPTGLTIGASTGTISGTPASNTSGPFTVVVTVTDSTGATAAKTYSLTVTAGTNLKPVISSVSTSAGGQALVAPNTWISVYGTNFAPTGFIDNWTVPASGALPTTLDNVTVTIGGTQAYVNYLSATQINVLAPNVGLGPVTVVVTTPGGGASAAFSITSQTFAPGYFNWPNNQPVATHLDFSYAVANGTFTGTTTVPAAPGETIVLWGSGDGPTNPAIPYGTTVPAGLFATTNNVTASINNAPATVVGSVAYLTSGNAGLYQVAVTVPAGLANGSYPVSVTVNGVTSPNNLMLTVHN